MFGERSGEEREVLVVGCSVKVSGVIMLSCEGGLVGWDHPGC